ncbi:MAG TPA: amidohydrolase family protein [Ilumatobacteraceae bacterium]|nr:amidohydrolase family protein [Ilumatobacteraceae bacterium]
MSLPIEFVDSHVHFWDHAQTGLTWRYLAADFDHPRLRGMHRLDAPRFTSAELREHAGDRAPTKIVHVQSCEEDRPGMESAWLQSIADADGSIHAIVARARVAEPDLATALDANSRFALVRGFRDMASPLTIGSQSFTDGFDQIADRGLSLEVLVPYPKFEAVCALADRRPEATIVLGHAGLAEHRDPDYFDAWSRHLGMFSTRPNVVVKISALASGADPNWTTDSIRAWAEWCIDVFGSERAMFASNWPIDRLYGSYERLVDAYLDIATRYTEAQRRDLFHATATRVYRLDQP